MNVSPPQPDGQPPGQPSGNQPRTAHELLRITPRARYHRPRRVVREYAGDGPLGLHRTDPAADQPRNRTILAVDIQSSTTRNNATKVKLRQVMYELLVQALTDHGIDEDCRDRLVDRGDGAMALVHPVDQAPKTVFLSRVIPMLARRLGEHNERSPQLAFRLRAMIHAGEVHHDHYGWSGRALDLGCRLLDSPQLKKALRETTAPLVLVVSNEIYQQVVQQGYEGIDDASFRAAVRVRIDGRLHVGWVQVPELPPVLSLIG